MLGSPGSLCSVRTLLDVPGSVLPGHSKPRFAFKSPGRGGNRQLQHQGSLVPVFLAPTLKLTEIKTGMCCKGTNAAKCHQLLAFSWNCFYPCGFQKASQLSRDPVSCYWNTPVELGVSSSCSIEHTTVLFGTGKEE